MSSDYRSRVSKGLSTGGQYAPETRAEAADVSLESTPSGALTEVSRLIGNRREEMERLRSELEELSLNAAVIKARELFPDATELRAKAGSEYEGWRSEDGLDVESLRTADGTVLRPGPRYSTEAGAWQNHSGEDGISIQGALEDIDADSPIWKDDDRCAYDPDTGERIIYLTPEAMQAAKEKAAESGSSWKSIW